MSLLNCWITPAEATIAVDSDGVGQDGRRLPSSKLLPIPHLIAEALRLREAGGNVDRFLANEEFDALRGKFRGGK